MKRGFEVACVVAAAALTAAFWLVDDGARLLVMAVWIVVGASVGALLLANLSATRPPEQRPQRFTLARGGFRAPPHPDLRRALGPLVLIASGFLTLMIDAHNWFLLGVIAAPIAGVVRNMRRTTVTLTPAGVTIAGRTLAWGEPTQVPRELAVNPWFVSAAIQWYADHPNERAGIGTRPGHERLRQALGAKDPVRPPRPPLPRNLVLASWFTWAGVAAGILTAVGDIVLAAVLRPVLDGDEDGLPLLATVGWLFVAIVAGLFAVVVLFAVRRGGNEPARVALMFLAGGALLVIANPLASPLLSLNDFNPHLGVPLLSGWLAGRAALAAAALAALIQLASAPVREFSRPLGSPAPTANPR